MASGSNTLSTLDKTEERLSETFEEERAPEKRVLRKGCVLEAVVLALTIATITGLLLLPIVFYHLPVEVQEFPPNNTSSISEIFSGGEITENLSAKFPNTHNEILPCREHFFREEDSGGCIPSCETWAEYSRTEVVVTDVFVTMSAVIGLLTGTLVIILAVARPKRMCTFPAIFVVYITVVNMILSFFLVISNFDRPGLYCSSPSLKKSIQKSTPFCVISGMLVSYLLLQLALWWLFHATVIFWKLQFPFHARSFENSGKIKFLHIACILCGLFIPTISIIASMADFAVDLQSNSDAQASNVTFLSGGLEYGLIRSPPLLCSATDRNTLYYSNVFPINVMQHGLFKEKSHQFKHPFRLGTAERKVLMILCYYVVVAVFSLSSYTVTIRNLQPFESQLTRYFLCELSGHDPSNPCNRSKFRQLAYPSLTTITFILLGLFPLFNLIYALNFRKLWEKCKTCVNFDKLLPRHSMSTTM